MVFKSEQKLVDDCGYASFWTCCDESVSLQDPKMAQIDNRNKNPLYHNMK